MKATKTLLCALAFWLGLADVAAAADAPRAPVLLLASFAYGRPGADNYIRRFSQELNRLGWDSEHLHVEYLDANSEHAEAVWRSKRELLLKKYEKQPPGLIVTLQQPALNRVLDDLQPLTRNAALVVSHGALPAGRSLLATQVMLQASTLDYRGTLRMALQLLPGTRRVFAIAGADPSDRANRQEVLAMAREHAGKLEFAFSDAMSHAELLRHVAELAPHTVVLHGNFNQDAAGARFSPSVVNHEVTQAANAPVFGLVHQALGSGIVGGSVLHPEREAERAAQRVAAHLLGEDTLPTGLSIMPPQAVPVYDWAQIRRWGAAEPTLTPEAEVVNRQAPLWESHRSTVLITAGLGSVLLTALVFLSFENRRRRRAERQALASQAQQMVLFQHAPDAIVLFDVDRKVIVDANPAAVALFGHPLRELRARSILDLYTEDQPGNESREVSMARAVRQALQGQPVHVLRRVCDGQGQVKLCEVRSVRIPHPEHQLLRLSYVDITHQHQERQALQESEQRWMFALEGAGEGVWDHDIVTGREYYSAQYLRMLGYEPGEFDSVQGFWRRHVHSDDLGRCMHELTLHIKGATSAYDSVFRMHGKGGQWRWIHSRGMVVARDPHGRPLRLVGVHADITERKEADASLEVASMIYRHAAEGLMVSDDNADVLAVNDAFLRLLGYERAEVIGRKSYDFRATTSEEDNRYALWAQLRRDGFWRGELVLRHKDGRAIPFLFSVNTIAATESTPLRYVSLFVDLSHQKESEQRVWHEAHFDALTGLPNRRLLLDRLDEALARPEAVVGLLLVDLDHFNHINESLGHAVGDQLLRLTRERLEPLLRRGDMLAHMGADEFAIMVPHMGPGEALAQTAMQVIERLRLPFEVQAQNLYVSASVGMAHFPQHGRCAEALVKHAGQALSQAKASGRDRHRLFDPSMEEAARYRMQVAADLREAIRLQQFEVHYQPIVELASGAVYKAEALLRWHHPTHGALGPAVFIPIAEETGLIEDIGNWVFEQATRQVLQWRTRLHPDFQISINKSPAQFTPRHTPKSAWPEHLSALGLPGQAVVTEITEGLLLDQRDDVAEHMRLLSDSGIGLSIDDFGTGYSSLAYVQRFAVQYIKIDKSFVRPIAENPRDLALCQAMVAMAHKLGLQVIAEGVETQAQHDLLLAMGCEFGQGYLYARPMPAEAFDRWLAPATA